MNADLRVATTPVRKRLRRDRALYVMMLPPLAMIALFKIAPMAWLVSAFQNYNIFGGLWGSEWVGLAHFERMFASAEFRRVVWNTLVISVYRLVVLFPAPILIALLLNELRMKKLKRIAQTAMYMPHFLSWVVAGAMITSLLQYNGGLVNELLRSLGIQPVNFLSQKSMFRTILVITAGWKDVGWNSIIYLAAITAIDPTLYEAAEIDGAGRLRQTWHITLSGISGTIIVVLLIRIGNMMASNMEQVLVLYNPLVYETGDVIDTYVYRNGIAKMDYSFPAAVGLFNSVINFALLFGANLFSRKVAGQSIW